MRRRRIRISIGAALAATALAVTATAVAKPAKVAKPGRALAGPWSKSVGLSKPAYSDLEPPVVSISPRGNIAIGYGDTYEDVPQNAYAALIASSGGTMRTVRTMTVTRRAPGAGRYGRHAPRVTVTRTSSAGIPFKAPRRTRTTVSHEKGGGTITRVVKIKETGTLGVDFATPERVPSAEQVLALGTLGGQPELLTGNGNGGALTGDSSSTGVACCVNADAQARVSAGLYSGQQQLASQLDGGTTGALVAEASGALAVVASASGVWTAYGSNARGFAKPAQQLAGFSGQAPVMAAGSLAGGRGIVVWTEPRTQLNVATKKQSIYYAVAPAGQPAGARRLALNVPAGRSVSQLAVARHQGVASIAWIENRLTASGRYRSRVYAADLEGGRAIDRHLISPADVQASQLAFGGGGDRPEVLSWQACKHGAAGCSVQATVRPRGGAWGPVRELGALGAGEAPVAGVTSNGTALVDWVSQGNVKAVTARAGTTKFGNAATLDQSGHASQLTLATGPLGTAVAAWTDGSTTQSLRAAFYRPLK